MFDTLSTPELLDIAFSAEQRVTTQEEALALIFALAWRLKDIARRSELGYVVESGEADGRYALEVGA